MTLAPLAIVLMLVSCAKPAPEIRMQPIHCPPVPQCGEPQNEIRTHADLAAALIDTRSALAICTIARNTLQACIDQTQAREK